MSWGKRAGQRQARLASRCAEVRARGVADDVERHTARLGLLFSIGTCVMDVGSMWSTLATMRYDQISTLAHVLTPAELRCSPSCCIAGCPPRLFSRPLSGVQGTKSMPRGSCFV